MPESLKVSRFATCGPPDGRMPKLFKPDELPREVITLSTYPQLELYLSKLASGDQGLVLLLGRHGTGKSECVRRALGISVTECEAIASVAPRVLCVEGHMQPYGLYHALWKFRDPPVILDDWDRLYADGDCVRILKPLCNTRRLKRITWLTNLTLTAEDVPPSFTTRSSVILIASEWRTVNSNVRALEDRAIILHFDPANAELHRRVGEWCDDQEVHSFLGRGVDVAPALSMRHYTQESQLRRAGLADWRSSLLPMVLPDPQLACVLAMQHEPNLRREEERVARFVKVTGCSRATYFRIKTQLDRRNTLRA
ncbi:MAG: hypothetical protein FLDDKLPJ_03595 [Phycisphaerae bacterium]|nr:hypothetical protein [Phycisphaerae bacterium]